MPIKILPSQRGLAAHVPLPYTASPLQLLWSDIRLSLRTLWLAPAILLPLKRSRSGHLGELHLSWENMFDLAVHGFLCVYQAGFLLSLPVCVVCMFPIPWVIGYAAVVLAINRAICNAALNGKERFLVSKVPVEQLPAHEREHWVFVNGVAVG